VRTNRMRRRISNPVLEKNIFDTHELEWRVNSKSTAKSLSKANPTSIETANDALWW
jgi:hypothetical protein